MPCEFLNANKHSDLKLWERVATKISLILEGFVMECLDILSGSETWCYAIRPLFEWFATIDVRYLEKAMDALKWCVEMMQRHVELAEAFTSEKKPDSYWKFKREYRRFLEVSREFINLGAAIGDLLDKRYRLVEIKNRYDMVKIDLLNNKLEYIHPGIGVWRSNSGLVYGSKKLVIGDVTLEELLESAEFVATEEEAVEDILMVAMVALPKEDVNKIEEAVEKLRLFKKLLDQAAGEAAESPGPSQTRRGPSAGLRPSAPGRRRRGSG